VKVQNLDLEDFGGFFPIDRECLRGTGSKAMTETVVESIVKWREDLAEG
jgi:hypothetical protein